MKRQAPSKRRPANSSPRELPVAWTERALADLEAIGDHVARDNPAAAQRWVSKLMAVASAAGSATLAGRRVPELGRDDLREVLLKSYRIVYRVGTQRLDVLTVFEGHRLFPKNVTRRSSDR